ncbi:MAG: winged helix-turn-helix transcriptional regulator [Candidatus Electrothrix sp. LOE2]|nr:winged helix-turn-helix transcriptional regulator [Candidatus Electrothrix sp. LOE2]
MVEGRRTQIVEFKRSFFFFGGGLFPPLITSPLTELELKILGLLKENPGATSRELADMLSMRPDTIKEYFGRLKAKGVLRREGSARSGYWVVLQEGVPNDR